MTAEPQDPNWSHRLPDRGPGELGPIEEDGGPVFAFYMTTVRVEVDPRSEEVIEVIVDEHDGVADNGGPPRWQRDRRARP